MNRTPRLRLHNNPRGTARVVSFCATATTDGSGIEIPIPKRIVGASGSDRSMLTYETTLARGFKNPEDALSPLVAALQRWKHIRGTLNAAGGELLCSALAHGRYSGTFCYPAQVLLRVESDDRISVTLRLERVTTREAFWLLLSFLFLPLLCAFPDARLLGLGIGLGLLSGLTRASFLLLGAKRVANDLETLYRSPTATRKEAAPETQSPPEKAAKWSGR
ncbi:MAG: hypothetical protein HYV96_16095 [Opitutae bacterium]|nr:hypothetical protein [Opitutae bacterium]